MLTQTMLKELVKYIPETGVFVRRKAVARKSKVGEVIGTHHIKGYEEVSVNGKTYLAHRLAWLYVHGEWPEQIDHINHDKKDNRIENLRNVNNAENHKNLPLQKNNTSGVAGVSWDKSKNSWLCRIKKIHIGRYDDFFEAVCARKAAEVRYGFHENHGCPAN